LDATFSLTLRLFIVVLSKREGNREKMRRGRFYFCGLVGMMTLFLLPLMMTHQTAALALPKIKVVVGKEVLHFKSQQPLFSKGKTYVPLREILEKMGCNVQYEDEMIHYSGKGNGAIDLTAKTLTLENDNPKPLDLLVYKSTTFVHIRSLAEILGEKVRWDNRLQTVFVASPIDEAATAVPVLMYHYLVPKELDREPGNNAVLSVEDFKGQMRYLHEQGYYTATLEELEKFLKGDLMLPKKTVVLTFDDGYQNVYIYAYPELKKYGFHAANFVVGKNTTETDQPFDPAKKSHLSWNEIKTSKDVFEYHSHTYDLHYKVTLKNGQIRGAALDPNLLAADIKLMKQHIDTPYISYPYGDFNQQVVATLKKAGYRMAFTVRQGFVHPGDDPMTLKRLTVKPSYGIQQFGQLLVEQKNKTTANANDLLHMSSTGI
jgi:peptidoglycan/xylan/chitin deacetylase (PgdA/CDA1 family)